MPQLGPWLRVAGALLLAVLPPLLLLTASLLLAETVLTNTDPSLIAGFVVLTAIAWSLALAIVYSRGLAEDVRSLLALAERGDRSADASLDDAYRQLAGTLDERNRQVAALATESARVPIDESPRMVVAAVVASVREVTGDATWRCAVLASESEDLLPPGTYHAPADPVAVEQIGELEQWAAVSGSQEPASRVEGPWGAFLVVGLAATDRLRAILYAPAEGRPPPTPAEVNLLTLVGQHAATALDHSLLYTRVRSQANELDRMAVVQADFLRGVTHDLQTPLTSIAALATEMRANPDVPEQSRTDLEAISHQAERLRRMVSQLLVASRLEAGVLTSEQEVFALPPVIERTWAALRADRPFELVVDGAPHLAVADPDRLEQVLWATLDNAVKYSPEASPITVSVRPEAADQLAITITAVSYTHLTLPTICSV